MTHLRLDRWSNKESQIVTADGSRLICLATENNDAQRIVDLWNQRESVLVSDPDDITAGVPDEVIDAGLEAWTQTEIEMENYVSGETTDWDDGMIVAAIFKAMSRALEVRELA